MSENTQQEPVVDETRVLTEVIGLVSQVTLLIEPLTGEQVSRVIDYIRARFNVDLDM